jgi:hypothetical protein
MGDRSGQQQPVFYDQELGQYYTQPQTNSQPNFGSLSGGSLGGLFSNLNPMGIGRGGERTYLNNFGQSSPALQQQTPYNYADVSLESLFPMLQGAMQNSQGGALDGLLSGVAQGATGEASSGAGRFL